MSKNISESMSKDLITVAAEDPLEFAYAKMIQHEIRHLPVTDENGQVVGIISERDVARSLKSEVKGDGAFRFESCDFNPDARIQDYMSWPVKTLDKDTSLLIAAERMIAEKISAFLVSSSGAIVGIITTEDLLRVLVSLLNDPKNSQVRWNIDSILTNPQIGRIAQMVADAGI